MQTTTSENRPAPDADYDDLSGARKKARKDLDLVEQKSLQLWERLGEQLIRPGVAGGIMGVGMVAFPMSPLNPS